MGGIAGFWGPPQRGLLEAMTHVITRGGPDMRGLFEHASASIAGPLSAADPDHVRQPVANEDGTLRAVHTGEIYNCDALRAELIRRRHTFRADSAADVILHAYEEYGPECFARLNGAWAIAIADLRRGAPRLVLCRDHFGIEPLYHATCHDRLLFASGIRPILQYPAFRPAPNDRLIYEYLLGGPLDDARMSFFEGIRRLPPAHYAIVDDSGYEEHAYWRPRLASKGNVDPAGFPRLLRSAIDRRLPAGAPAGVLFSGGPGSALIGLLTKGERLPTVSIEGRDAEPGSESFLDELAELLWHEEEPTVAPGDYARWRVLRPAATRVRVVLDGQGGDELLSDSTACRRVYLRQLARRRRHGELARDGWTARGTPAPLLRRSLEECRSQRRARKLLGPQAGTPAAPNRFRWDDLETWLLRGMTRHRYLAGYEDGTLAVTFRRPFLDPGLAEWLLSLPPADIARAAWARAGSNGTSRSWRARASFAPEIRWLRAHRAQVQSLFRSPEFCGRRYWNGLAVAEDFAAACRGSGQGIPFHWRVLTVELWLRLFFDRDKERPAQPFRPHRGKQLAVVASDGTAYLRIPVRTRNVWPGDDLADVVQEGLSDLGTAPQPGDLLAVSEKIVAIGQGRSSPADEVHVGPLARFLSRFVSRTPSGIGFRLPAALQLAIEEAGTWRILAATAAAALTRPLGIRGAFYLVAGRGVTAIDSPVPNALPPCDTHIKLAPLAPDRVSDHLAGLLSGLAGGRVEVAVVDANDIGAEVLGASAGVDHGLLVSLLRDNPLGQDDERTPLALIRRARQTPIVTSATGRTA